MMGVDKESMGKAYLEVRDDKSEKSWAVFKYDDKAVVVHAASGTDYGEFVSHFTADCRAYGYVRIETGDEMSRRAKFAFITWIGEDISPLQKAKVSTDKGSVKQVIQSFAAEITTSDHEELELKNIKEIVVKAGGANYGTAR